MSLVIPGYTLQDVDLSNVTGLSINRVGGGDFQMAYSFKVEDELGKVREEMTYSEVLTGAELGQFAAFVTERLPAINVWWPEQV